MSSSFDMEREQRGSDAETAGRSSTSANNSNDNGGEPIPKESIVANNEATPRSNLAILSDGEGAQEPAVASAPTNSGSTDNNQEEKSLKAVSIQQQFAWTGLSRNAESSARFDDLILWNVLGYAVDTSDYLNLMLVCKEWKSMVLILEPPMITAISRLLQQDRTITQDHLLLWTGALVSLQSRESALYRKERSTREWPTLQPHFNIVLMLFVFHMATQQTPNHSTRLYELTTDYLQEISQRTVNKLWGTLEESGKQPLQRLDELVTIWCKWQGVVDTVDNLTNYLNRYYAPHHNLPLVKQAAEQALVNSWRESLNTHDGTLTQALLDHLGSVAMTLNHQERALLLEAWKACEILQGVGPEQVPNGWTSTHETFVRLTPVFTPVVDAAKEEQEASMQFDETPREKPITIVSRDGPKFPMTVGCHFVASSGFLTRLRLRAGDVVKLNVRSAMMEKAIEFYNVNEIQALPEIPKPLQTSLEDIVGESYWNFVSVLGWHELFELIMVANVLYLKQLLDLTCTAVANMIRGRSPEELRTFFAIQNDFDPEEEAQIQEELA